MRQFDRQNERVRQKAFRPESLERISAVWS